jgi:hypothetical protein
MTATDPMAAGYRCIRCSHNQYDVGQIRVTGGMLAKIFDVQNKKFTTVTCQHCQHTELFRADSSKLGSIFDLFTN